MQTVHLVCKLEKLREEVEYGLASHRVSVSHQAKLALLVDAPWGWAQGRISSLNMATTLVLSDNPCPEYCLDLLSYDPITFLSGVSIEDIAYTLNKLFCGDQVASCTAFSSSLTPTERLTLQLIAKGHTPKQIANIRGISGARVKNTLQVIYQKLGLNSRAQLALYYYGVWHVLEEAGWERPKHRRY